MMMKWFNSFFLNIIDKIDLFILYFKKQQYLESKSKAIKKSFTDCMSSSTGHGLPQIVKDGSLFLKILWAIFFVAGVTATIFMIYNTLENFFQYDVITTTRIKSEKEIVFPVVTFCLTDNSSIRNALSGCQFGRFPKLSCNLTELTLYTKQSIKRSCIQLGNSNKGSESYKSIGEGYSYGFQLYIYHPPQSIIKFSITENGMKVVNDQIRYNIFARHETELGLSVTQEYSLGPPYSDCISTQEYSMEHCISECYEKKMSSVCDCEYPSGCKAQSQWPKECLYAYNNSLSLYVSQCRIGCQSRCHKTFYTFTRLDIELDSNRIKLDQIKSDLEKNFNFSGKSDDQIIKRLSKIYIYFDKLETTVIRQIQSFTIISLIANVGGILGKL